MKRFAVYTLILTVLCLGFTGCSDYFYEDGIDALNEIETVQVSSTVDTDLKESDDGTEKAADDGDEETDIYALFDNLFEETEKPADTEPEKTNTEEESSDTQEIEDESTQQNIETDEDSSTKTELETQTEDGPQSKPSEQSEQSEPTEQTEQTETTETKPTNASQELDISDIDPVKEKEQPVPQEAPTVNQEPVPQASQQSTSTVSNGVWIPQSGKKYHSHSGCSGMKNPSNVTLEEVQRRGFTKCKRCY